MQTVRVQKDFTAPPERVFAHLSDNDNLGVLFAPARVEHVRDGETERNGVGSVRRLSFWGLLPFEETVTAVVPTTVASVGESSVDRDDLRELAEAHGFHAPAD